VLLEDPVVLVVEEAPLLLLPLPLPLELEEPLLLPVLEEDEPREDVLETELLKVVEIELVEIVEDEPVVTEAVVLVELPEASVALVVVAMLKTPSLATMLYSCVASVDPQASPALPLQAPPHTLSCCGEAFDGKLFEHVQVSDSSQLEFFNGILDAPSETP